MVENMVQGVICKDVVSLLPPGAMLPPWRSRTPRLTGPSPPLCLLLRGALHHDAHLLLLTLPQRFSSRSSLPRLSPQSRAGARRRRRIAAVLDHPAPIEDHRKPRLASLSIRAEGIEAGGCTPPPPSNFSPLQPEAPPRTDSSSPLHHRRRRPPQRVRGEHQCRCALPPLPLASSWP